MSDQQSLLFEYPSKQNWFIPVLLKIDYFKICMDYTLMWSSNVLKYHQIWNYMAFILQ